MSDRPPKVKPDDAGETKEGDAGGNREMRKQPSGLDLRGQMMGAGGAQPRPGIRRASSTRLNFNQVGPPKDLKPKLAQEEIIIEAPPPTLRKRGNMLLDNKIFTAIMTIFTIYALFGDDIRLAGTTKPYDDVFYGLAAAALGLFLFELLLSVWSKDGYTLSFYFWLDLIATLSLIPDIGWVWEPMTGTGGDDANSAAVLKAGRASRAGTRASRIVRIVRLVRLVRIVKLYKMHAGEDGIEQVKEKTIEPSEVSRKLNEMTTRRLIVMVLLMVLILPLFDGNIIESEINEFQSTGLAKLHHLPQDFNASGQTPALFFRQNLNQYARDAGKLLYIEVCPPPEEGDFDSEGTGEDLPGEGCFTQWPRSTLYGWLSELRFQPATDLGAIETDKAYTKRTDPISGWSFGDMYNDVDEIFEDFRSTEVPAFVVEGCFDEGGVQDNDRGGCISSAFFDGRDAVILDAILSICKTIFIMIILATGVILFQQDAQALVVGPIERMMDLVRTLSENPLASTENTEPMLDEEVKIKKEGYESALLEHTMRKVGALVQIGFGAAGGEILRANMAEGCELNPLIDGNLITSIYGFCDIRNFTDTTECLQEEVMVYVNKLGDIVHTATHDYYGMANKNVGDAFLLSWKICNGSLQGFSKFEDFPTEAVRVVANNDDTDEMGRCKWQPGSGHCRTARTDITPTEMADSAVTAFLRCIIDLENANEDGGTLADYLVNKRVVKRFGPDFRIRMGFGMHVGWAIEGAIGSRFKIDATYLSPHVEMSDRLEAGSKIFRTPLNISHWLFWLLSPAARRRFRPMDCILVEGCASPMTVYTMDVTDFPKVVFIPKGNNKTGLQNPVDWTKDEDYKTIQASLHPDFVKTATAAVEKYFKGRWVEAEEGLEQALTLKPGDGPIEYLLEAMRTMCPQKPIQAPKGWSGYHQMEGY